MTIDQENYRRKFHASVEVWAILLLMHLNLILPSFASVEVTRSEIQDILIFCITCKTLRTKCYGVIFCCGCNLSHIIVCTPLSKYYTLYTHTQTHRHLYAAVLLITNQFTFFDCVKFICTY